MNQRDSGDDRCGSGGDHSRSVSCAIMGGLANQMFQVANVLAYAHRHGCIPVFDTSVTRSPSMLSPAPTYWDSVFKRAVALGRGATLDKARSRSYSDPAYEFREISVGEDDIVFRGHFLSYKYFHDCREHIIELFTGDPEIRREVDAAECRLRDKIPGRSGSLVSLHVRRGDSLENHTLARLSLDYYRQATLLFRDACFVVFSDDIPWCRSSLDFPGDALFVEGETDYVDMMLMARCDHHIIANSTFSWWGAYLNEGGRARVIYPYPWFSGKKHRSRDMSDFFLPAWERLYSGDWLEL